jgi:hypothetical protein
MSSLLDNKNDLTKMIEDNLGVDVTGSSRTYQQPYRPPFDMVQFPAGFRISDFVEFNGEDNNSTSEPISCLAQLREDIFFESIH